MRAVVGLASAVLFVALVSAHHASAEDLNPPLKGMTEYKDDKGIVRIELPVNSSVVKPDPLPGALAKWTAWIQKPKPNAGADINLDAVWEMPYARAGLARYGTEPLRPSKLTEGSVRAAPGYLEERRYNDENPTTTHFVLRYHEHAGSVVVIRAYANQHAYPHIRGHIDAILDTFKVLKAPPRPSLPDGFTSMEVDGREVWTDTDKKAVKACVKMHKRAWDATRDILEGEPFIKNPPRMVICGGRVDFDGYATGKARDNHGDSAYYQSHVRAVIVNALGWKKRRDELQQEIELSAVTQCLRAHFGGELPEWFEVGLSNYVDAGLDARGKPAKPKKSRIQSARAALEAADRPLDVLFSTRDPIKDRDTGLAFTHETWAWHWFFRHGPGAKKYGPRYTAHIAKLRATGDPLAARKAAWDGTDFAAMHQEALAWAKKWR